MQLLLPLTRLLASALVPGDLERIDCWAQITPWRVKHCCVILASDASYPGRPASLRPLQMGTMDLTSMFLPESLSGCALMIACSRRRTRDTCFSLALADGRSLDTWSRSVRDTNISEL